MHDGHQSFVSPDIGRENQLPLGAREGTYSGGYPSYVDNANPQGGGNLITAPRSNIQPENAQQPTSIGDSSFLNRPIGSKPTAGSQDSSFESRPSILAGRKPALSPIDGVFVDFEYCRAINFNLLI